MPRLHIVHCIDVEGPMKEPIEATFERLRDEDSIDLKIEATKENLKLLQSGGLIGGSLTKEKASYISQKYAAENLLYKSTWNDLIDSIINARNAEFRRLSTVGGRSIYKYSWFIFDQYGFSNNPRFKHEGVHGVWDIYQNRVLNPPEREIDGVYWHYHHPPVSGDAIEWNTNLWNNGVYEEILARRIIDRSWFPSVFRAGGHIERNDFSYWLEQFVPFDYSGRTPLGMSNTDYRGHVCDWRGAPTEWGAWHPDFYDYRLEGDMRRWIFRCLDLITWMDSLTETDVASAFERARSEDVSILAYYTHDYREFCDEVDFAASLIEKASEHYSDVEIIYSTALEAARDYLGFKDTEAPKFEISVKGDLVDVSCDIELFGPSPFLAVKENDYYFRDNMTCEGRNHWCYRLRRPSEVKSIGVAGNTASGLTGLKVLEF